MPSRYQRRATRTARSPWAQNLRVLSMIVMLVVIGMTIARNRPWEARRVAAPGDAATVDKHAATTVALAAVDGGTDVKAGNETPAAPQAADESGTTKVGEPSDGLSHDEGSLGEPATQDTQAAAHHDDRDSEEAAEFRRQSEAIIDWGLAIQGIENPAYWRLLNWIGSQSLEELKEREPQEAVFQQLRQHPHKYRGKLLELELSVRRVVSYDVEKENPAGVKRLYELWGWPTAGRGWFYVVVTPELPAGFPTDMDVTQTVRVYGYFFKLQGYQPANAQPNAPPLAAPMIVGRVEWVRLVTPTNPAETTLSYFILTVGSVLVLSMIGYWIVSARRKKMSRQSRASEPLPVAAHEPQDDDDDDPRTLYEREYEGDEDDPGPPAAGAFDWVRD